MKKDKALDWLTKLQHANILRRTLRNGMSVLHLNTPVELHYSEKIIGEFHEQYDPKFEKGGYVLFKPSNIDGTVFLNAVSITWVKNVSTTPESSYRIGTADHLRVEQNALDNNLLPIRFHTHPTHSHNIVQSQVNFLYQLGTSDTDKKCSFINIEVSGVKLILPDLLLVGKQLDSGIFIGVYNGLVTPLDFQKHKRLIEASQFESIGKGLSKWLEDDTNKFWAGLGVLLFVVLGMKYPKGILPAIATFGIVTQDLSMRFKSDDHYFGIANKGAAFRITLPQVTPDIIDDNEKVLAEITSRKV